MTAKAIETATANLLQRRRDSLSAAEQLLKALSPQATLARGYSITRVNGKAVTNPADIPPGATVETTLAAGKLITIVPKP